LIFDLCSLGFVDENPTHHTNSCQETSGNENHIQVQGRGGHCGKHNATVNKITSNSQMIIKDSIVLSAKTTFNAPLK